MPDQLLSPLVEEPGQPNAPNEAKSRIRAGAGPARGAFGPSASPPAESPPQADYESEGASDLPIIPAGWPEEIADGCVRLDPAAVLRATPRSFALRVRGQSMANADIYDGDIVVGEFTPQAPPGAIVAALIDGESTLKRLVVHQGRPYLASENPNCPNLTPLSELVIQGVVHTVVRQVR